MELETLEANGHTSGALAEGIAHLMAATSHLERTASAIEARFVAGVESLGGEVPKLVATIDPEPALRIAGLEARLQAAEQTIAELRAQTGGTVAAGRKTLPVAAAHLLAKHGIDTLDQVNGGALDAALNGLSLEQRIAVKSQLIRAGLLG